MKFLSISVCNQELQFLHNLTSAITFLRLMAVFIVAPEILVPDAKCSQIFRPTWQKSLSTKFHPTIKSLYPRGQSHLNSAITLFPVAQNSWKPITSNIPRNLTSSPRETPRHARPPRRSKKVWIMNVPFLSTSSEIWKWRSSSQYAKWCKNIAVPSISSLS